MSMRSCQRMPLLLLLQLMQLLLLLRLMQLLVCLQPSERSAQCETAP